MSDILEKILVQKHEEVVALRKRYSAGSLAELASAQTAPRGFAAALRERASQGAAVIAEIKKASPSRGMIRASFDPDFLARDYARGGAACLSVLTDERFFLGSAEHLKQARAACPLPVLRKDFTIDALQVAEARALGADAILLIAAALAASQMNELAAAAIDLGLDVLVEIHSASELELVQRAKLPEHLLGINNRDLRTFQTQLETTLELLPQLPPGTDVVTESGIGSAGDLQRMLDAGVRRFLVGESLMRAESPGAALEALLA
ncbi:MAG TPA: indole-3-glycerol phosphate synthase TrpC [Verrucomicrobiae bacterium]|nr:indole-3-glycerol phosphate synthase TrpC [Verrucomicrobiae bacterium]